jgi:hypothetical protein
VAELLADVRTRLGDGSSSEADDRAVLSRVLLTTYRIGLVDLMCQPPRFATAAGPRPRLSPLVRAQIETGAEILTSLRPSIVRVDNPITRELLSLLDGTRDRGSLLFDLADHAASDPRFTPAGEPRQPAEWWRERLSPQLEAGLAAASRMAVLLAE